MVHANAILHTDGSGYWSKTARPVRIVGFELGYVSKDGEFGSLDVFFDEDTWNIDRHGLIYTDNKFLEELRNFLISKGFDASNIDYSEQGMQGADAVNFDVDGDFIKSYVNQALTYHF
jgi:hypothetical protein